MPVLPVFDAQPAPNPAPIPEANPAAMGQAGAGIARAGNELGQAADQFLVRYAEQKRRTGAAEAMVGAQDQLIQAATQASQIPDLAKAHDQFVGASTQIKTQLLNSIDDPQTRDIVTENFDEAQNAHLQAVQQRSLALENSGKIENLDNSLLQFRHDYAAAPSDAVRASIMSTATNAVAALQTSGILPGEAAFERLKAFSQGAAAAQAQRDIDQNPVQALDRLNDEAWYTPLDELTRQRFIARAQNKAGGDAAAVQGQVDAAWRDNLASIERTGTVAVPLGAPQIRAAFARDPARAETMIAQTDLAGQLYRATQSTALTSPAEDAALVQKFTPQGQGFAMQAHAQDALRTAISTKYQALASDPAGYVLGASPEIKGFFDAAQKDPAQLGRAVGALDAAYDRIGVPPDARRVLTGPQAQQLASTITAQPDQAPATITALAQHYGATWPRVWRDLTQLGGLPSTWQAVPVLENSRDGALLARWLTEAPKNQTAGDLIGAQAENQIKASVRIAGGVTDLLASLSRSGASATQTDGVLHAIDALAFAKSYYDRDPQAAQDAVASFTSRYEFMPNGGARVPRELFDDVSTRAGAALGALDQAGIAIPPSYGQPGGPKPQEYLDWIKAAPSWITSPNADALWLMDPTGRLVKGEDGKPLAVPFTTVPMVPAAPGAAAAPPVQAVVPGL